jgi:hypothetical protein
MLCENDDNYNLTNNLEEIEIMAEGDILLSLIPIYDGPENHNSNKYQIKIYDKVFKVDRTGEFVGNIYWNSYRISMPYLLGLINHLMNSGKWQVEQGWSVLFDKFKKKEVITSKDFGYAEDIKPTMIDVSDKKNWKLE